MNDGIHGDRVEVRHVAGIEEQPVQRGRSVDAVLVMSARGDMRVGQVQDPVLSGWRRCLGSIHGSSSSRRFEPD